MQILKQKKIWLSKLYCRGNINIDVHVTTILKCSQINFSKSRFVWCAWLKAFHKLLEIFQNVPCNF